VNPIVHGEVSWLIAQGLTARRDRLLVVAAGLAPDLDGLSLLAGQEAYGKYHHLIFHGYVGALITMAVCTITARNRGWAALLSLAAFHCHLLCDLAGSGREWPIYYFWPTNLTTWGWSHGWELVSWQNTVIGFLVMMACLGTAVRWRRTFVEVFSTRADAVVVATVRARLLRSKQ
jgi:inner membrane protein